MIAIQRDDLVDGVRVELLEAGGFTDGARTRTLSDSDDNLCKAIVAALAEGFAIEVRVAQSGSMPTSYRGIAFSDAEAIVAVRLASDRVLAVRGRGRPEMRARATMVDGVMPRLPIKTFMREQARKSRNPRTLRAEFAVWEDAVREFANAAGIGDDTVALQEVRAFVERTLVSYAQPYDKRGFDAVTKLHRETGTKWDPDGYGRTGYHIVTNGDRDGFDRNGRDVDGYDRAGYDFAGWDRAGFDRLGFDREGYDRIGRDRDGCNRKGRDWLGRDRDGFDEDGYDCHGYDRDGRDRRGYDRGGFDREGRDRNGLDAAGYDRDGFRAERFPDPYGIVVFRDRDGFDRDGYDEDGYGRDGYDRYGVTRDGRDRAGKTIPCQFCGAPISGGRLRQIAASGTKRRTCCGAHTAAFREIERAAKATVA